MRDLAITCSETFIKTLKITHSILTFKERNFQHSHFFFVRAINCIVHSSFCAIQKYLYHFVSVLFSVLILQRNSSYCIHEFDINENLRYSNSLLPQPTFKAVAIPKLGKLLKHCFVPFSELQMNRRKNGMNSGHSENYR